MTGWKLATLKSGPQDGRKETRPRVSCCPSFSYAEIGTDVSRFRNASAFASWLRLCPENKTSSGKSARHSRLESWCQDNRNRGTATGRIWNHGRSRQRRLAPPNQLHKTCAAKRGGGQRFIAPKAEPSALISGIAGGRQSAYVF
jgi:Transposase IS116/IS110/IS902 family